MSGSVGGSITLDAVQDIDVAGHLSAAGIPATADDSGVAPPPAGVAPSRAPSVGGRVTLSALHDITLQGALIDVSGDEAAGRIDVQGGSPAPSTPPSDPPTLALIDGTELEASSRRGKGGVVTLTADRVNLLDTTAIDASGAIGGGDVFVGGGFHGRDPSVADAQRTALGSGVSIDASATQAGDGGQVVIWSSQQTDFAGSIQARGGASSGSGGTLEVSGAKLGFTGSVDAGAPHGTGGSLLLDPQDINVVTGGTDSIANETFATNASSASTIDPSALTAVTNTGTAVTLQANDDITISSAIQTVAGGGTGGALAFQAGRSITVNASVISDNGNVTFSLNDIGATSADRNTGAATFTNNSVINAGTGAVSITLGTLGTGGDITTGQITAASLAITDNGTTAGTTLDLDETDLTGALSVSAASANPNLTNSVGTITAHGATTLNVGTGSVTITNPNTDFTTLGLTAGVVDLVNTNAIQFSTTSVASLIETAQGPIAQTSGSTMTVSGAAGFTADYGGFGYADPYIKLTNSGNHFGSLTLDVPSNGGSGTGGYATIEDSSASGTDISSSSTTSSLALQAAGPVTTGTITATNSSPVTLTTSSGGLTAGATTAGSLSITAQGAVILGATTISSDLTVSTNGKGAISNTGAISDGRQTTLTAGSANDITLDNPGNSFNYIRVVSGDNVTLVDTRGPTFGSYNSAGGWTSHIYGNFSLTAGGDINQIGESTNDGYSDIEVDGTTAFTADNATAPINLYLGTTNPTADNGQKNDFAGTVTLARDNTNTGFSTVELRNINAGASVLTGLTSVGTLANVYLTYDDAPSLTLPGMTVSGNLSIYAASVANTATTPTNVISQSGPIAVGGEATFQAAATGDIDLTNTSNDFNKFVGIGDNIPIANNAPITLVYGTYAHGNMTVTANGNISDYSYNGNTWEVDGTLTLDPGAANDIQLTSGRVFLNTVVIPEANDATVNPVENLTLGNVTISGSLVISDGMANGWPFWLAQVGGTAVKLTGSGTTTLAGFGSGITLTQPNNVLGPLAISNSTNVAIEENAPITQASAWNNWWKNPTPNTFTIALTTTNDQEILLSQAGNNLGPLTLTQLNAGATSFGAVDVVNTANGNGLTQGGAWSLAGATSLDSGSYSVKLNNLDNVLGPLQVTSSAGTTNGVASSITIYAKNTATTAAISDVGAAGAWTTGTSEVVELVGYDSTGSTEGGGDVTLTNPGNVLGPLYLKANNVTITENASIVDGPIVSNWDGANDGGWATTGSMSLVVANPTA
ncbi:MAG: beta strand repeat-containing protein, partial [Steroidobacteraceae bacterium]